MKNKVLIVVDMQNDFVTGPLGSDAAQAIFPAVREKIIKAVANDDKIIFTRDTHAEDYLETQEGKKLPVTHCLEGTDGWQIVEELESIACHRELIINKPTFGSNEIVRILKIEEHSGNPGILTEIELCGLCTDICVVTNALILKTAFPEAKITVDAKATAGVTPESTKAALLTMKMCQIEVLNCD